MKNKTKKWKKIWIIIGIPLLVLGCSSEIEKGVYQTITPSEVEKMKNEQDITIIDVRTIAEYASGHIKNAINIPLDRITDIEDNIKDKTRKIIVYCRSGARSKEAADKLLKIGYTNVYDMKGLDAWEYELEK